MKIKASGRSALIVAAGFWIGFLGPLHAGGSAANASSEVARKSDAKEKSAGAPIMLKKFAKHKTRHARKAGASKRHAMYRSHQPAALAGEAVAERETAKSDVASIDAELPASVTNAYAQLAAADGTPADATPGNSGKTQNAAKQENAANPQAPAPAATPEIVASDQLNELDLAAVGEKAQSAAAKVTQVASSSASDDDTWSRTSLIGKIFIAFGSVLTLASAARMFMA